MTAPYYLENGSGHYPDNTKIMADVHYAEALARGNKLQNGGQEDWAGGTSFTNPANAAALSDAWTLEKGGTTGATANVTREGTTKDTGVYAMKLNITGAGSSDSYLKVKQALSKYQGYGSRTVLFGMRVHCATANKVRLSVYDGTTTAYSSYHTGGGTWERLSVPLAAGATPSELTVRLEITSDFTGAVYLDSAFVYHIDANMSTDARAALAYEPTDEFVDAGITSALAAALVSIDAAETEALGAIEDAVTVIGSLQVSANATPDNKVAVAAGSYRSRDGLAIVVFAGGQSPAFSAVTANSRIDLLCIDDAGTLTVQEGNQMASPTPPPYPLGKITLAEVTINDTGTVTIAAGDIKDVRNFLHQDHGIVSACYAMAQDIELTDAPTDGSLDFETKVWDSHAAVTTGASWKFTAPVTGTYRVRVRMDFAHLARKIALYIYKNGSASVTMLSAYNDGGPDLWMGMWAVNTISLTAGDYISVGGYAWWDVPSGTKCHTSADWSKNFVTIELV